MVAKKTKKSAPVIDTRTTEEKIQDLYSFEFCPKPNRFFNLGDKVVLGGLEDPIIVESHFDGKYYTVEHLRKMRNQVPTLERNFWPWYDIFPVNEEVPQFYIEDDSRIRSSSMELDGLIHKYYNMGIDMNPEYQRGYEWTRDDKVKLIETIFDAGQVGLIVLNQKTFSETGPQYEIVDGKQRLSAIIDFIEDKLYFQGYKFSQMSKRDRSQFEGHVIEVATLQDATRAQILRTFLKINRAGKPISEDHINKIRKLYINEIRANEEKY